MDHALCADVTEEKDYWKDLDPVFFSGERLCRCGVSAGLKLS